MKVHAYAALEEGGDLEHWTYEIEEVRDFECVVEVEACGLCRSDLHMIDNDWRQSTYPLVPGHEVIGEVVELGENVEHLEVGQRVGVGWQRTSCLYCQSCLKGDENLCDDSKSLIGDGYGGFADYLEADSRFVFPIPDQLETDIAGPLLCGGITVFSALKQAGMTSGGHVGVIGVGGLGHLAVQFASKLGNRVTVFTSTDEKAEFAQKIGADEVIVSSGSTPGTAPERELDVLLNTAPVSFDWAAYLETLGTDGTLSIVGAPDEPMEIPANALMFKRRRVTGSVIGGRAAMNDMLRTAGEFDVTPVTETFPMSDVNRAIEKLRRHDIRYRAVLVRD